MQALADMSDVERKLALERYKLLEPHLQNGRELRSVSKGSDVSFRTLQRWNEPRASRSKSSRQLETALSLAKPETRRTTTNNSTKATTNNSPPYK